MKKVYFVEIVKDGETIDVASTQADNYEGAAKIIDAAAAGRGFTGFNLREVTEEYFIAFKNQKQEEAAIAEAAAQPVTQPGLEAAAGEQGNAAAAQAQTDPVPSDPAASSQEQSTETEPAADPAPAAEDNSESLAGDSQGVPVTEGTDAAQENPEKSAEAQAEAGDKAAAAA